MSAQLTVSGSVDVQVSSSREGCFVGAFKKKDDEIDRKAQSVSGAILHDVSVKHERERPEIKPIIAHHPITDLILESNPVGLHRNGMNCWLNTLLETVVLTTPQLMDWIMAVDLPLNDDEFDAATKKDLAVMNKIIPKAGSIPEEERSRLIGRIDASRQNYIRMHLKQFLYSYFSHQLKGIPVPAEEIQVLRNAISHVSSIRQDPSDQEDLTDGMNVLMNLLPADSPLYTAMRTTLTLNAIAHPFPRKHPEKKSVVRSDEWGNIPLPLGSERNFTRLISDFASQSSPKHELVTVVGEDGRGHLYKPAHESRVFERPPPFLFINLKRFEWHTQIFTRKTGGFFGFGATKKKEVWHYRIKITDTIPVTEEIYFPSAFVEGTSKDVLLGYRINAIGIHQGATVHSGHYWSLVRRGEQWWYLNDSVSRLAKNEEIEDAFKHGYNYQFKYLHPIPDRS